MPPFPPFRTFRALAVRNYRLYFFGQLVSVSGSWMQAVAQDWLVLKLTGQSLPVGVTVGIQFLPMLLFGLWSGSLADRFDKRRLLVAAQTTMGVLALALGTLCATSTVRLWMIYVLAFLLGCANAVDHPARQAMLGEMVGAEHTPNAIALNGAVFNSARVVGPALAGVVIGAWGLAAAFFLNAGSFLAVLAALGAMRVEEFKRHRTAAERRPRVADGLRYVWAAPILRSTLLQLAVFSTLGLNFRVLFPLLARFTFHAGVQECGFLSSLFAVGSVAGALLTASRSRPGRGLLAVAALAFGVVCTAAAAAPTIALLGALMALAGFASVAFLSTCNSLVQLGSDPALRGRVMAVYALIFLGSTPLGAVVVGWLAGAFGPRSGLLLAGGSGLVTAAMAVWQERREQAAARPCPEASPPA